MPTRFDDYLAAQEEAALEGGEDPFGMANEFTTEELDEVGYTDADPALQAEVAALIAQTEAIGIDTYAVLEDIARTYANATQDQYNAAARDALAQAIARSNQDGGGPAPAAAPAEPRSEPEQGLNRPAALTSQAQEAAESVFPKRWSWQRKRPQMLQPARTHRSRQTRPKPPPSARRMPLPRQRKSASASPRPACARPIDSSWGRTPWIA